ncbi:MAG: hypothetical protein OXC63_07470 [Aestuariivita sp.]|nr:hypothetical protein [Aestuariivita sp.]
MKKSVAEGKIRRNGGFDYSEFFLHCRLSYCDMTAFTASHFRLFAMILIFNVETYRCSHVQEAKLSVVVRLERRRKNI